MAAAHDKPPLPAKNTILPSTDLPVFVMCGPSGVGKGTLIEMLQEKFPGVFGFRFVISAPTMASRLSNSAQPSAA